MYPNRTLCDVLEEMRSLDKTKNYSSLLSLIEEVQSMANRMESKLHDVKDLERVRDRLRIARKKLKKVKKKTRDITGEEENEFSFD